MLNEGWRRHRARHRRRRRLRRDPQPAPHRRAAAGPVGDPRGPRSTTVARRSRRWTSTRSSPATPRSALVDELAHTNVPGSRNEKRWQDVEELLDAGIDVISTVNIQHLESLNDVVEGITGIRQQETIPDAVVRAAEQIELVDSTPEALRRRMAHGNIYGPDKVDAALGNYFRPGNLAALRELALLWVADRVDESLQEYRERHGIAAPWETRERVAVAVTGAPGNDNLIRRASRIASRAKGDLIGVHVRADDGLATPGSGILLEHRRLVEELGGTYREVVGSDVAKALVQAARAEGATQLVLGASRRSRWDDLTRRIGHRRDHPGSRPSTRRPRDLHDRRRRRLRRANTAAADANAAHAAAPAAPAGRVPGRGRRAAAAHPAPHALPRRHRVHQRRLLLPHDGRGRGHRRGHLAGGLRRRGRVRVAQLVLCRAHPHLHDPQRARPGRGGGLPRRGGGGQHPGRRRRPAYRRGQASAERGRGPRRDGRLPPAPGRSDPGAARQPRGPVPPRPRRGGPHRTGPRGAGRGRRASRGTTPSPSPLH